MESNTMNPVQDLKAERVQEEIMAAGGGAGVNDPLVISLKAERVQEPAAATVPAGEGGASYVEVAVNPYQRVAIDLPELGVNITFEQPVAGASWNAGLAGLSEGG